MPLIDGLEIVGDHAEADGIEAIGTHEITITRTTVHHCRHAVHLVERNRNVIINACHLYCKNSGIGVFYDNVNLHQSNITGCHISYCYGGSVVSHAGNVRNVQISGCDIESNMAPSIPPAADAPPPASASTGRRCFARSQRPAFINVLLDSTGSSIGEVAITGCTLQHSSKSPGGASVRIIGRGDILPWSAAPAASSPREGNVTIADNVFSDVQINVDITDARGVTITGNTFWEDFQHDLRPQEQLHIVIANNNFDRNPRYLVNGFNAAENNGIIISASGAAPGQRRLGVHRQRAAVDLVDCSRFNIAHNTILDSDGVGIRLEETSTAASSPTTSSATTAKAISRARNPPPHHRRQRQPHRLQPSGQREGGVGRSASPPGRGIKVKPATWRDQLRVSLEGERCRGSVEACDFELPVEAALPGPAS